MKVVTFGEIMMRLNPEGYQRIVQADKFEASYAGGEANVAVSLANFGLDASFVTKLPDNLLGESARNAVRHFGVDTKDIVWGGSRLGLYFVEKGASQRASKVIYHVVRAYRLRLRSCQLLLRYLRYWCHSRYLILSVLRS